MPAVQGITETDVVALFGTGGRQADSPTYRYYEMAGTAHLTVHEDIEVLPAGLIGPEPVFLEDLCQFDLNTLADGPVFGSYLYNAMWRNLDRQVRKGTPPPAGRVLDLDGMGQVARDGFGNALGGVRVPEMDVPTGRHDPPTNQADPNLPPFLQGIGNLACFLGGSTTPFTPQEMQALYRNRGGYVDRVVRAANELRADDLLLQEDRQAIVDRAAHRELFACGLGFELAFVLPLLMKLRRRRRGPRLVSRLAGVLLTAAALLLGSAPGAVAQVYNLSAVALTGDTTPDDPGATFTSFGPPSLNDAGEIGIRAGRSSGAVEGIYHLGSGAGELVLATGTAVPGAGSFSYCSFDDFVDINAAGDLAFAANFQDTGFCGEAEGWFTAAAGGSVSEVTRTGDVAPDTGGETIIITGVGPAPFDGGAWLDDAGAVTLFAVTDSGTQGLFLYDGSPSALVLTGQTAPGTGGTFLITAAPSRNNSGDTVFAQRSAR